MNTQQQETLEGLIDTLGLFEVLDALSGICGLKAEHIASNWQDNLLASHWEKASDVLSSASLRIHSGL